MNEQKGKKRGSLYDRKMSSKYERKKGKKRLQRTIAAKLRKYEVHGEGYEFLPVMMHLANRYLADLPEGNKNELDKRLAEALDEIPNSRKFLEIAVKQQQELPRELKRRVFSPKYLDLNVEQSIGQAELSGVIQRANLFRNRRISSIGVAVATAGSGIGNNLDTECCCCCCQTLPGESEPPPTPTKPPNQYELTFTKLYCVDESDPEWAGSDEPYVVFAMITEEMAEAGTAARGAHSPVYEDVDDGNTRPESGDQNLRLFGFTGPRSIDSSVLITASCFENDLGNPEETTNAIRTALTTVATTAAGAGGVAGWVVAGVAVVGIGVSYLVDLIGADDQISSSLALSLTEAQADMYTDSINPYMFPPLHFDGGDDDGIYDVYLKLRRL